MHFSKRNYYFHLSSSSPTYHQLAKHFQQAGWKAATLKSQANFTEKNLQFNPNVAETLEYKHLLTRLCKQHCPDHLPMSYEINDYNWPQVVTQITDNHENLYWILKPSLINNGQNIHIFQSVSEISDHFLRLDRLGGEHILQHYIASPHLLQGPKWGHKYSIRMLVIITNVGGIYLYPHGYFNIALQPYNDKQFKDLRPHLTNEHLVHDQCNVVQIPTFKYALFKPFYPKIKIIIKDVINALVSNYPQTFNSQASLNMAFFGFDFMVDAYEKLWLLEANHAPCFPIEDEHPLQASLYHPFWHAVVDELINPLITENKTRPFIFEKMY